MTVYQPSDKQILPETPPPDIDQVDLYAVFNLGGEKFPPSLWGLESCVQDSTVKTCRQLFECTHPDQRQKYLEVVQREITVADDAAIDLDAVVLSLSAAQTLVVARQPSGYQSLVDRLLSVSQLARGADAIFGLLVKSLGIELGLTVAVANSSRLNPSDDWSLVEEFEAIVAANLDADGWPDARLLAQLAALAGCWARTGNLLDACGITVAADTLSQLEWLVRQCVRLTLKNGCLMMGAANFQNLGAAFWRTVASLTQDPDDLLIIDFLKLPETPSSSPRLVKLKRSTASKRVAPYNVSEWSGSFLLRSDWSPKACRVAADFSDPVAIEFAGRHVGNHYSTEIARSVSLVSGTVQPEILVDDEPALIDGGFDVVCNQHDKNLDYIELQADLNTGGTLVRQWLLSRTDEFLWVADSVVPNQNAKIDYRCRWPLANKMLAMAETETREIYLMTADRQKIQSLVLPLALPEWKAARSPGALVGSKNDFSMELSGQGGALFVPLVFDLKPRRAVKKRTWRPLSLVENRQPVPGDHGAAYRFQLNNKQWFFYRALASKGNRTFLGENTVSEFVFNRFHRNGRVESLIEVE